MSGDLEGREASERDLFAVPAVTASTGLALAREFRSRMPAPSTALARAGPAKTDFAGRTSRAILGAVRAIPANLRLERDRGTAFLFIPVLMAAGAAAYFSAPSEPNAGPLALATGLALGLALAAGRWPLLQLTLAAVLFSAVGAFLAKLETMRAGTMVLGSEVTTALTGRVARIETMPSGRVRLTIDVESTERPTLRYPPERVRVTARSVPPGLRSGAVVSGLVRLMPPAGPVRPGSYDFSFESYFDGVGASGFFLRMPVLTAQEPAAPGLSARIDNFRSAVAERVRSRIGGPQGEVAAALLVGVRAGIPEDLSEVLRVSGLYHVISISGLHMALVAGTVMFMLRAGLALFPDFSARHAAKKYAAGAALLAITAYLLVSGAEVAAQRSYLMLAVMLIAILAGRAALTLRNLAISAIIVILVSPHEVMGPSFQMSFAATAALVGAYAIWADRAEKRRRPTVTRGLAARVLRLAGMGLAGLAATSLIAGVATSIFAAYHFHRVSPLSLMANLAAMPIVSAIVMPAAVFAALAMPLGADGIFLDAMGIGIGWMSAIAAWTAARSPDDVVGIVPGSSVILLAIAIVIGTLATTALRWFALAPALAGMALLGTARYPDVLVSEDAKLVAVVQPNGRIAVTRSRPNAFTLDNWQRATNTPIVLSPVTNASETPSGTALDAVGAGVQQPRVTDGDATQKARPPLGGDTSRGAAKAADDTGGADGFSCNAGLCLVRHVSGMVVAVASDAGTTATACRVAGLVISADATVPRRCPSGQGRLITLRDLARRGAASIIFDQKGDAAASSAISYAVATPYRPWHQHRQFSRAARGLPPYQRPAQQPRRPDDAIAPGNDAPDTGEASSFNSGG